MPVRHGKGDFTAYVNTHPQGIVNDPDPARAVALAVESVQRRLTEAQRQLGEIQLAERGSQQ